MMDPVKEHPFEKRLDGCCKVCGQGPNAAEHRPASTAPADDTQQDEQSYGEALQEALEEAVEIKQRDGFASAIQGNGDPAEWAEAIRSLFAKVEKERDEAQEKWYKVGYVQAVADAAIAEHKEKK